MIDSLLSTLRKYKGEEPLYIIFVGGMALSILIFLIMGVITKWESFYEVLCTDKNDIFMDYFRCVFFSWEGHPYSVSKLIYPPLIIVVYNAISDFVSIGGPFYDAFDIRSSYMGMFSYCMFAMFGMIFIKTIADKYLGNRFSFNEKFLLVILLLLSYPTLYAVMRGSNVFYAVIFALLFLLCYKSENRGIRYISYACLGIAAGIRVFPLIYCALVFRERNHCDSVACVFICCVLFFLPIVFTDGDFTEIISNAFKLSSNWINSSQVVNIHDLIQNFNFLNLSADVISYVTLGLAILLYLLVVMISIFNKHAKKWELVAMLTIVGMIAIGTPVAYLPIFMIMCICAFFKEEKKATPYLVWIVILFMTSIMVLPGCKNLSDLLGLNTEYIITGLDVVVSMHTFSLVLILISVLLAIVCRTVKDNVKMN